jgi:2-polyprenyl-3-methyl-5-hydroxy-6-metoxy-1,4-benzoquinol methylase
MPETMQPSKTNDSYLNGGYARVSHFDSPAWKEYAGRLEGVSSPFNRLAWGSGQPADYKWPTDPLHQWSRIWEYPFAAAHLDRIKSARADGSGRLKILDVGPAVTFFSAYLVQQGFSLTNFDYDEAMVARFDRAYELARHEMQLGEKPEYLVGDARDSKLPDESYDVVLCVSVLEHIPGWERVVKEFVRILRPGGSLILTFDVKYKGNPQGLNAHDAARLLQELNGSLVSVTSQEQTIPADVLHMKNSPHPMKLNPGFMGIKTLLRPVKHAMKGITPPNLCIFGGVWRKPADGGAK